MCCISYLKATSDCLRFSPYSIRSYYCMAKVSQLIKGRWCLLCRTRSGTHYLVLLLKEKNKSQILQLSLWHLLFQDLWLLQSPPDPDHHHYMLSTIVLCKALAFQGVTSRLPYQGVCLYSPWLPFSCRVQSHFAQNGCKPRLPGFRGNSGEQEFS